MIKYGAVEECAILKSCLREIRPGLEMGIFEVCEFLKSGTGEVHTSSELTATQVHLLLKYQYRLLIPIERDQRAAEV